MPQVETAAPRRRVTLYDGLRGVAIVLVVLSHGWTLWPMEDLKANPVTKTLFTSGNFAVTIFFVVGFFLTTRSLMRRAESDAGFPPMVLIGRRYIRIAGQLAFALVVLTLITSTDDAKVYQEADTRTSLLRIMTFTWNQYLQTTALDARSDLGHLWYLSVDFQVFIFVVLVIWLLRRHRAWLLVTLTGVLIACFVWRTHVYEIDGIYNALLRTTVRMDAPIMGALAAVAMPYLGFLRPHARWLAVASLAALFPLAYFSDTDEGFFGIAGVATTIVVAIFMVATTLQEPPALIEKALGFRPLAWLGERSLSIYIWHYPLFWYVAQHSDGWSTFERTIVGFGITLLASLISEYLVERRVQRFLADDGWRDFDRGLIHGITQRRRRTGAEPQEQQPLSKSHRA
jgi:peptidoglycan/LPS O-acetylase OafA/YrhL